MTGFRDQYGVELLNHIGVNTGEVIAGDATHGQRLVTGDTVNTAARLEQAAGPAEIILGDLTHRLARDQVEVEVDAAARPQGQGGARPCVPARHGSARRRGAGDAGDRRSSVARPRLGACPVAVHRGRVAARARLITVVGDAGVGKTRLIREFATRRRARRS